MLSLLSAIRIAAFGLTLLVLVDIVVRYFLDPFHPMRAFLDSIVEPMLAPIRRVVPPVGMFDLSPIVLLILIQLIEEILVQVLLALV